MYLSVYIKIYFKFAILSAMFLAACAASSSAVANVFISNSTSSQKGIQEYSDDGRYLRTFGTSNYVGLAMGLGGTVYGTSWGGLDAYDSLTGALLFSDREFPTPYSVTTDPYGNPFVSSINLGYVGAFDGTSGEQRQSFTPVHSISAPTSLHFGPDGNLYVLSNTDSGEQFLIGIDALTGALISKLFFPIEASSQFTNSVIQDFGWSRDGDLLLAGRLQNNGVNTYGVAEMVGTSNKTKVSSFIDDGLRFGGSTGGASRISILDDGSIFLLGSNVLSEYSSEGTFQRDVIRGGLLDGPSAFVVSRTAMLSEPESYIVLLTGLCLIGVAAKRRTYPV
jgi:hypothetical protein